MSTTSSPGSLDSQTESQPYHGFGFSAPIIDFYKNGELRRLEPISDLLEKGPEKCMAEAKETVKDANLKEWKMRWVHIPSNNTKWVERVIKCISRSKAKACETQNSSKYETPNSPQDTKDDDLAGVNNDTPTCLRPEYWRDQQRGCIKHNASHLLYAQHMVPFFTPIFDTNNDNTDNKKENPKGDMVLFMPYLHWATSSVLAKRNEIIRKLEKSSNENLPSHEEVDKRDISPKLKLVNAFLFPKNKRCLHIRRTLDQFYYPTLPQDLAEKRTADQVVYRFAEKQYRKHIDGKWIEKGEVDENCSVQFKILATEESKHDIRASEREIVNTEFENETPWQEWKDPKVLMVNQFWMWVIDEDTIITSFPAKLDSSELVRLKKPGATKIEKTVACVGDACFRLPNEPWEPYDSSDIWTSVVKEIESQTEYGNRSKEGAFHLAWTIADQATGVIHKRTLPPHLQFIEMFEMEISEISFRQAEAFDVFTVNVQLAHNTNEIGKVLCLLESFQDEALQQTHVSVWKSEFSAIGIHFRHKLGYIKSHYYDTLKLSRPLYTPPVQNEKISSPQPFDKELNDEFLQFADLVANAHPIQEVTKTLHAASSDLAIEFPQNGIHSAIMSLRKGKWKLEKVKKHSRKEMVSLAIAMECLDDAIAWLDPTKMKLAQARSCIDYAKYYLDYNLVEFLERLFAKLETIIERIRTTRTLNKYLDHFIRLAKKSLDAYNDMILDDLFDIRTETHLVREIKDIIDELNIIQAVKRDQQAVIKPFRDHMIPASAERTVDFFDCSRLGSHVGELRNSAEATYKALSDLLELKQKEASAINARSASKDAKASAKQAEEAAHLSEVTVEQGRSIMIFTIFTIIFLPLSFFTSLFGMNAKELMDGNYTIGYFSAIMWPVSFTVICFSLSVALSVRVRKLLAKSMKNIVLVLLFQDEDWRNKVASLRL